MNKGLPVHGYKDQPDIAVTLVNENKITEEEILRALDTLAEGELYMCDRRWLAIARTHFEQAFMAVNRAIFQPQRASLPGDNDDGVAKSV